MNETANQKNQSLTGAGKSLFICTAELSADLHGEKLVKKLKAILPDLEVWGMGGNAMEAAGMRLIYNCHQTQVPIGIFEVVKFLPTLHAMREDLIKKTTENKPDVFLLMDSGGFNVGFATSIRKRMKDVPIIYFISPQVWGSRPWRINAITKAMSKMLVIFPFEEALYKQKNVNAKFVGHPLTSKFKAEEDRESKEAFCAKHNLDPNRPIVGVFPGSRRQEISEHAELILKAIDWLERDRPEIQFVIANASKQMADLMQEYMQKPKFIRLAGKTLKTISSEHNESLMTHSDILWTKSGTTTLEATVIGKPMLIFYRASWPSFLFFLIFKIVKYIGWPNLLHGEGIVPELIQLDCRAEQLVRYTCDWLDVPGLRREIAAELKTLKSHLGEGDFTDNALTEILAVLKES